MNHCKKNSSPMGNNKNKKVRRMNALPWAHLIGWRGGRSIHAELHAREKAKNFPRIMIPKMEMINAFSEQDIAHYYYIGTHLPMNMRPSTN